MALYAESWLLQFYLPLLSKMGSCALFTHQLEEEMKKKNLKNVFQDVFFFKKKTKSK